MLLMSGRHMLLLLLLLCNMRCRVQRQLRELVPSVCSKCCLAHIETARGGHGCTTHTRGCCKR